MAACAEASQKAVRQPACGQTITQQRLNWLNRLNRLNRLNWLNGLNGQQNNPFQGRTASTCRQY